MWVFDAWNIIKSSPAEKAPIVSLLYLWIWSFAFLVNHTFWMNVWARITILRDLHCLKAGRFPWSWLSWDTFADWGITSLLQESHNNQNSEKLNRFLRQKQSKFWHQKERSCFITFSLTMMKIDISNHLKLSGISLFLKWLGFVTSLLLDRNAPKTNNLLWN